MDRKIIIIVETIHAIVKLLKDGQDFVNAFMVQPILQKDGAIVQKDGIVLDEKNGSMPKIWHKSQESRLRYCLHQPFSCKHGNIVVIFKGVAYRHVG